MYDVDLICKPREFVFVQTFRLHGIVKIFDIHSIIETFYK